MSPWLGRPQSARWKFWVAALVRLAVIWVGGVGLGLRNWWDVQEGSQLAFGCPRFQRGMT